MTGAEEPVREAQFIDDGGFVRLYAVADGHLTLWVLGAPDHLPVRSGQRRRDRNRAASRPCGHPTASFGSPCTRTATTPRSRLRDRGNNVLASTGVTGLVSHIRWAPTNNEIVFTLGLTGASGGVRQDLYVWDLEDRKDPCRSPARAPPSGRVAGRDVDWGP